MDKFLQALNECSKVNYNLDGDGICSYLLLKKAFPMIEFGGFTNSDKMILSRNGDDWKEFSTLFIDIFLKDDNLWSLDQHIYLNKCDEDVYSRKINPHGLIEERRASDASYCMKYPFSTAHFILASLERNDLISDELPFEEVIDAMSNGTIKITFGDLFMNLDGVLSNYLKYEKNVREWAPRLIKYSNNGKNTTKMFEYLFSKNPKDFVQTDKIIRGFYMSYGLEDDGGFNPAISMEENIRLIENLKRSFNKYIGATLDSSSVELYEYIGDRKVVQINESSKLVGCDTFAYVGKNKLSYTSDIKQSGNGYNFKIFV